jgi:hypothetical protein
MQDDAIGLDEREAEAVATVFRDGLKTVAVRG